MADAEPAAVFAVANAAIVRGDAPGAIAAIDAALALGADPELHLLRGQLAYLLCDWEPARAHFEAAVRVFEALNRFPRAALTASWLGRLYFDGIGHQLAARGWFARADRLLEQEGPCVERGWVAIPVVGCSVANVDELEQKARLALDVGRQFGDVGLEAKALADGGLALVTHGRVRQGMSWLDEAMAMVTGGLVENPVAATGIRCCVMSACERCGDLGRAEAWLSMMDERNPILYSHCRIALASLFCELGRWGEADVILQQVVDVGGLNTHKNRVMAQATLAELRIRQGRLDEAEALLLGLDDRVEVLGALSRLHLACGDASLAAAVSRRGLRMLGSDRLRAVPLLAVLSEAEAESGDLDAARRSSDELQTIAEATGLAGLGAEAAFAASRVLAAAGQSDRAIAALEAALSRLGPDELPYLRSVLHLELARLHASRDPGAAVAEAQAAVAIRHRAGTPLDVGAVDLLGRLGVAGSPAPPDKPPPVSAGLRRDGQVWTVSWGSTTARHRPAKGLTYLAALLAKPGVDHHALDLVDLAEGAPLERGVDRRRLGDAGSLIDQQAKSAYRRRLEDLRQQMDEADAAGDERAAWRIQAEIDALVAELSRAIGLGGRERRAGSAAERARVNVTRALRSAIARIGEGFPDLGGHLDRSIRTGLFCSYTPPDNDRIAWRL